MAPDQLPDDRRPDDHRNDDHRNDDHLNVRAIAERRDELEKHEFMMGTERGRLAVSLDMLTDALILVGQHGVYCVSNRNPSKPALDLQVVLDQINGAKQLIQSTMQELERKRA